MNGVWNSNWHPLIPFLFHLENFTKMCFDQTVNLSHHKAWQISDKHIEKLFFYLGSRFALAHFTSNCLYLGIWNFCSFLSVAGAQMGVFISMSFTYSITQLNGSNWIWCNISTRRVQNPCASNQWHSHLFSVQEQFLIEQTDKGGVSAEWIKAFTGSVGIKIRHAEENDYLSKIIGYREKN